MRVKAFLAAFGGVVAIPDMGLGQPGPRERELWIQLDRAFKSDARLIRFFFGVAIEEKAALQIRFMRLDVFRPAFLRRLHLRLDRRLGCRIDRATSELTAQLRHDRLGQLGLHREDVLQIARVIFRPDFLTGLGLGQPCRDPHHVAGFAHAAFDQPRDSELLSDFLRGGVLCL